MPWFCSQFSPQPRLHLHWTQDSLPIFLHHHLQCSQQPAAGRGRKVRVSLSSFQRGPRPVGALSLGFCPWNLRECLSAAGAPSLWSLVNGFPREPAQMPGGFIPSRTLRPPWLSQCGWPRSDPPLPPATPGHPGKPGWWPSSGTSVLDWALTPRPVWAPLHPISAFVKDPAPCGVMGPSTPPGVRSGCGGGELVGERVQRQVHEHLSICFHGT